MLCQVRLDEQLAHAREQRDERANAEQLDRARAELERAGFEVGGDTLKTQPRGFDADHPRIALLRHKALTLGRQHGFEPVIHTPEALDLVREDWRTLRPFVEWVQRHVQD